MGLTPICHTWSVVTSITKHPPLVWTYSYWSSLLLIEIVSVWSSNFCLTINIQIYTLCWSLCEERWVTEWKWSCSLNLVLTLIFRWRMGPSSVYRCRKWFSLGLLRLDHILLTFLSVCESSFVVLSLLSCLNVHRDFTVSDSVGTLRVWGVSLTEGTTFRS